MRQLDAKWTQGRKCPPMLLYELILEVVWCNARLLYVLIFVLSCITDYVVHRDELLVTSILYSLIIVHIFALSPAICQGK